MKEVKRKKIRPIFMESGDEVRITHTDNKGEEYKLAKHIVDKTILIDTIIIFELENGDFDLEAGYGAAFGKGK